MGILQNFKSLFNTPNTKAPNFGVIGSVVPPDMTEAERLRNYNGWPYVCISAIAENVSNIQLELVKLKNGDIEDVVQHELLDLLFKVNPFYTLRGLLKLHQVYKELAGESFWYLETGKDNPTINDKIKEIWVLRPDWIDVVPDDKQFIKGYVYKPPSGKHIAFNPSEIIHFKYPNPVNVFRGHSPLMAGAYSVEAHKYASQWNRNFFYNSARVDAVLEVEDSLGDKAFARLKSEWDNAYRGKDRAHKLALLENGVKYKTTGISPKDMDFSTLKNMSRDEILGIWRVPKSIVGITDDVNRANAEASIASFQGQVIKPKMQDLVDTLNEFLVIRFGDTLYLDFEDPVPENREARSLEYEKGHNKWITTNEIRLEDGRPPVEGGDILYVPITSIPVGEVQEGGGEKMIKELKVIGTAKDTKKAKRLEMMILAGKTRLQSILVAKNELIKISARKQDEVSKEKTKNKEDAKLVNKIADLKVEVDFYKATEVKQKNSIKKLEDEKKVLKDKVDKAQKVAEDALELNNEKAKPTKAGSKGRKAKTK